MTKIPAWKLYRERHPCRLILLRRKDYLKHREKRLAYSREYSKRTNYASQKKAYRKFKDTILRKAKNYKFRHLHGIPERQVKKLTKQQRHKCAICSTQTKLSVDHCHKSKKVRGMLCNNCNWALGLFKGDKKDSYACRQIY